MLALTFGLPRDLLNFYTGPGDIFLHLPSLVEPPIEVLEFLRILTFFFFYKLILFLLISNIIKLMLLILRSMSLGILS